jgi:hypothetical protein
MSDIKPPPPAGMPPPLERVNPPADVTAAIAGAQNACRSWAPVEVQAGDVIASTEAQVCNEIVGPMTDSAMVTLTLLAFLGLVALGFLIIKLITATWVSFRAWFFEYFVGSDL